MRSLSRSRALVLFATLLWGLAIAFPAIRTYTRSHGPTYINWFDNFTVLALGWGGLIFGQLGWFANPMLVANAIALWRGRQVTRGIWIVQIVLAGWSLIPTELGHNEAFTEPVCAYGPGFWLWMASQAIVIATAALTPPPSP